MPLDIIFLINVISVFLLGFFSFFLLSRNGQKRPGNRLLAGFLLINAVPFLFSILAAIDPRLFSSRPTLFLSFFILDFLMGPLIYLYTRTLSSRDFRLQKKHWPHLLPVILFLIYLLFSLGLKAVAHPGRTWIQREIITALLTSHVLLVFYALMSIRALREFRAAIKNVYSYTEKISLSWLRFVLAGFGTVWALVIVNCLVRLIWKTPLPHAREIIPGVNLVVSIIIIYYGLTRPKLFTEPDPRLKYLQSTLTPESAEMYRQRLEKFMREEKPHLTPSLTIDHLSEQLDMPPRHLSQLLNEAFQQNFFDFINRYRVEEAKQYLSGKGPGSFNLSRILFEVGFNSKASFNRAFSKHAGMTPREFRRRAGYQAADGA